MTKNWKLTRGLAGIIAAGALVAGNLAVPLPAQAAAASGETLDTAFNTVAFGSGLNNTAVTMVETADGGFLLGGSFTALNGNSSIPQRLIRFSADGTLDTAFNANLGTGFNDIVRTIVPMPDGGFLIGGYFTSVNGNASAPDRLYRLNADGTPNTTFNANLGTGFGPASTSIVNPIAITHDDKILLGGGFTTFKGATATRLYSLNLDGTANTACNTKLLATSTAGGANGGVRAIEVQPDGKILVGGEFTSIAGSAAAPDYLVRLNSDCSFDTSFNANLGSGFNSYVWTLAALSDSTILVGGDFTALAGNTSAPDRLLRLNADGTANTAFNTALGTGFNNRVLTAKEADGGGIYVGGSFTMANGDPTIPDSFLKLTAAGLPDEVFNAGFGTGFTGDADLVQTVLERSNGNLLLGGLLTQINGVAATPPYLSQWTAASVTATPIAAKTGVVGSPVSSGAGATVIPAGRSVRYGATGLPPGVSIDPDTGAFSGTPTAVGNFSVTVLVTLPLTGTSLVDEAAFTWQIDEPPSVSGTPGGGTVGQPYSYSLNVGGSPAPTITQTGGTLPNGVNLNADGTLEGTPTVAGTFTFEVTATNGVLPDAVVELSVTISDAPVAPWLSGTPPAGVVGTSYAFTFNKGGVPLPEVSLLSGNLPMGLSLDSSGSLSGTPTVPGTYAFTLTAINGVQADAVEDFVIDVTEAPTLTGTPGEGVVGTSYNYDFEIEGSPTPIVTLVAGELPPGLTLSSTGNLSGTPTQAGVFEAVLQAANGTLPFAELPISITVNASPNISGTPVEAVRGRSYAFSLTVSGFPRPTVAVTAGVVPPGMAIGTNGAITGRPTQTGTFVFTVTASNGIAPDKTLELTITVVEPLTAPTLEGQPSNGVLGRAYSYAYTLGGFPIPTAAVTEGALPPGLSLAEDGVISGIPTQTGTFSFTVTGSNGNLPDAVIESSLTIAETPIPGVPSVAVSHKERRVGQKQNVIGSGFEPAELVSFTLHSTPVELGSATANDKGEVHFTFTIPAGTSVGDHTVTAAGRSGQAQVAFRVVAGAVTPTASPSPTATGSSQSPSASAYPSQSPTSSGSGLARSGAAGLPWVVGGGIILLVSGIAVVIVHRRNSK